MDEPATRDVLLAVVDIFLAVPACVPPKVDLSTFGVYWLAEIPWAPQGANLAVMDAIVKGNILPFRVESGLRELIFNPPCLFPPRRLAVDQP